MKVVKMIGKVEEVKENISEFDFLRAEFTDFGGDTTYSWAIPYVRLDAVLEIMDKHGEQLVKNIVDGSYPEIKAADILASVREDVLALKGGEQT